MVRLHIFWILSFVAKVLGLAEGPSIRIIPHLCRSAFMTWCCGAFKKEGGQLVIARVYFILVLGAAPCSLLAAKSPSNKALQRASFG